MNLPLYVGMPVLSLHGEGGVTFFGQEIETGPNALGIIVSINPELTDNPISVVYTHGIIAAMSTAEIYDRQNYSLDVALPPGFESQAVLSWAQNKQSDYEQYRLYARNLLVANYEVPTHVATDATVEDRDFEVSLRGYAFVEGISTGYGPTGNKQLDARELVGLDGICISRTGNRQLGISMNGTLGCWVELEIVLEKSSVDNIDSGTILELKAITAYPHKRSVATYSKHEDEEAAFQQLQQVWNQVADLLRSKPAGTTAQYPHGALVMAEFEGALALFDSPDIGAGVLPRTLNVLRIEDFEGPGKLEFDDMRALLEAWLKAPTYGTVNPVLVAESIEDSYSETPSDPYWLWNREEVN